MHTFSERIYEAGEHFERQETAFVDAVNKAVKKSGSPIVIETEGALIANVEGAYKFTERTATGSEPYTDVQILKQGGSTVNISMKGQSTPSVIGGGITGVEAIIPGLGIKFFKKAHKALSKKLKSGDIMVDVYAELSAADQELLVVGNKAMGGPINYIYTGPLEVIGTFDEAKKSLRLDGTLMTPKRYSNKHNIFLRLRQRASGIVFDPDAFDKNGVPKIGRLVTSPTAPLEGGKSLRIKV